MTKIKITTTQNIDIEYELATIFDRVLAWFIDAIAIIASCLILWVLLLIIAGRPNEVIGVITFLPVFFYHLLFEWLNNGRSLGKLALRIQVVRIDGSPAGIGNYLLRWVFRMLETNPVLLNGAISVCSIAFSKTQQRLGDHLAGTVVIRTERKTSMHDTILARTNKDYEPIFPQVKNLTDADMGTIKDVIKIYQRDRNPKLLNICANKICHVLDIIPPNNLNAEQFLKVVLRDYSHIS